MMMVLVQGAANRDYSESELANVIGKNDSMSEAIVQELVKKGEGYKAWLIFCSGIEHSKRVAAMLTRHGVRAEAVHSGLTNPQRQTIIDDFRANKLRAVTNANILTTGFNVPCVDIVAFFHTMRCITQSLSFCAGIEPLILSRFPRQCLRGD